MGSPRVHVFSYYLSPRDRDRGLRPFQTRDDRASWEIFRSLAAQGYLPGESLLNPPPRRAPRGHVPFKALHRVEVGFVRPEDRILVATRPPMHDRAQGDRKKVGRGYTDVEHWIFQAWQRFIERSARSHILLTESVAENLKDGFEAYAEMKFREAIGAPVKELTAQDGRGWRPPERPWSTVAFLLHLPALWPGGPGLINAFGMDGTASLAWAYNLGHDWGQLLEEPGLIVALLECAGGHEGKTDLRWAADWKVEVVLQLQGAEMDLLRLRRDPRL